MSHESKMRDYYEKALAAQRPGISFDEEKGGRPPEQTFENLELGKKEYTMKLAQATPTRKVTAATAGAALGELIGWVLTTQMGLVDVPTAAVTIFCTFALGWAVKEKA